MYNVIIESYLWKIECANTFFTVWLPRLAVCTLRELASCEYLRLSDLNNDWIDQVLSKLNP